MRKPFMMVLIAIGSLTPWYTFYVFLAIIEAILTFIIVWKAFKWPKEIAKHKPVS